MTLRGGIFTAAPVRGLRPTRSDFCCTLNVPSPVRVSRSPSRSDYRDPDHGVDGLAGVYLRDVRVEGDGLDKLRFVHGVVREETNLSVLTY